MSNATVQKNRKPFALAMLVVIAWFIITGVFGPLFGKLSSVQENNNSSFLPKGAEATLAADQIKTFSGKDSFNFPTLILFEGKSTPATYAAIQQKILKVGELKLADTNAKISDYLAPGQRISVFPSQDGKALLANIPLDGNAISKLLPNDEPVLPAVIEALRKDIGPIAKANGFTSYVTGPGGLLGDLFGAFATLDSSLLLTTLGVVAVILIVVYRSPILWIIPLLSSLFALSTAGGIVYLLAKNNILDVDGQSQGILSVLVIGAATDYALLLIARYREELHHHENRYDAMRSAYKGVWEPILASGSTVAISLLILLLSQLTNTAGLGPRSLLIGPEVSGEPTPEMKVINGRAILQVTLNKAPDSVEAGNDIPKIRELAHAADKTSLVGGTSAVYFDVRTANNRDNKTIIPIILFVITLILGLLLRSIVSAIVLLGTVVLAATFAVLGLLPLVPLAQLGFAVAFGVLLDTIIVRSILVPALVREIGPKIWWPSKLQIK